MQNGRREGGDSAELSVEMDALLQAHAAELLPLLVDGLCILDDEGLYVSVSESYARLVGFSSKELIGQSFMLIVPPELREVYQKLYREAVDAPEKRARATLFSMQRKDGARRSLWTRRRITYVDGRRLHAFVVRDVTDQQVREMETLHANRVRTLGLLAGGVAHEFNNLLVSILGYAEMLLERSADETTRAFAGKIARAARRGTDITAQVLPFARGETPQRRPVELHDVLREALDLGRVAIERDRFSIDLHLHASNHSILGDAVQLQQVFVNLLLSARDTMPAGGLIEIRTDDGHERPDDGTLHLNGAGPLFPAPASYVVVSVRMRGTGVHEVGRSFGTPFGLPVPKSHREDEPSSPNAGATGLGMALVMSSVESHGGRISVESEAGETTIRVSLPCEGERLVAERRGE